MLPSLARPLKRYPLAHFSQWATYEHHIEPFTYVKKYLASYMQYWVETVPFPMEIPTIQNAFTGQLQGLDSTLQYVEGIIGSDELKAKLTELNGIATTEGIIDKWASIVGEFYVLRDIAKEFGGPVRHDNEYVDWWAGDTAISVKTKQGLEWFWDSLLYILSAQYYVLSEHSPHEYCRIEVSGLQNGVDYRVREQTFKFIRQEIPLILERDEVVRNMEGDFVHAQSCFTGAECNVWVEEDEVEISVSGIPIGDGKQESFYITLSRRDKSCQRVSLVGPYRAYFRSASDVEWLRRHVKNQMKEFERSVSMLPTGTSFVGMIVIPTHLSLLENDRLIDHDAINNVLQDVVGNPAFHVRIVFVQEFVAGNDGPIVFEFK